MESDKFYKCKLCLNYFSDKDMSEEHYPAKSVGNNDIISLDILKLISGETQNEISSRVNNGESLKMITDDIFDNKLSKPLHPAGRTARTLCKSCNTFLGKYDKSYLSFFQVDGNSYKTKGFQIKTKYEIIKAIFAKFLSIPDAENEVFDFLDFIKNENLYTYDGKWNLYFVKRDHTCDFFGFKDIGTGKAIFDEGVVYELSDDKFIYNLMNFKKHDCYPMTNIFDILNKNYTIVEGVGEYGGYHASILIPQLLK